MSVLFHDALFDHVLGIFWSEKCAVLLNCLIDCTQWICFDTFSCKDPWPIQHYTSIKQHCLIKLFLKASLINLCLSRLSDDFLFHFWRAPQTFGVYVVRISIKGRLASPDLTEIMPQKDHSLTPSSVFSQDQRYKSIKQSQKTLQTACYFWTLKSNAPKNLTIRFGSQIIQFTI